jgi:hypothetical protein
MSVDVVIYDDAMTGFLHDPVGPVGDIMERAGSAVAEKAKLNLLEPGSGRTYTTFFYYTHFDNTGVRIQPSEAAYLRAFYPEVYGGMYLRTRGTRPAHTASAPGRPATTDTGDLLDSVESFVTSEVEGPVAHVGSPLDHALFTELGTREIDGPPGTHRGMHERPWLRPALDALVEADLS